MCCCDDGTLTEMAFHCVRWMPTGYQGATFCGSYQDAEQRHNGWGRNNEIVYPFLNQFINIPASPNGAGAGGGHDPARDDEILIWGAEDGSITAWYYHTGQGWIDGLGDQGWLGLRRMEVLFPPWPQRHVTALNYEAGVFVVGSGLVLHYEPILVQELEFHIRCDAPILANGNPSEASRPAFGSWAELVAKSPDVGDDWNINWWGPVSTPLKFQGGTHQGWPPIEQIPQGPCPFTRA